MGGAKMHCRLKGRHGQWQSNDFVKGRGGMANFLTYTICLLKI